MDTETDSRKPIVQPGGATAINAGGSLQSLLTPDEAASLLRTTRRAVYAMAARAQLPGAVRIGRRLLIRRDDLLDWLGLARNAPETAPQAPHRPSDTSGCDRPIGAVMSPALKPGGKAMTTNDKNEGTADLERLTTRQLQARLKKLTGRATASNNRPSLIKRCAAAMDSPTAEAPKPKPPHKTRRQLDIGTVLTRTHKGREVVVTVTAAGFEFDGTTFTSLSTLAKTITGYHVSGPAFFKLTGKQD